MLKLKRKKEEKVIEAEVVEEKTKTIMLLPDHNQLMDLSEAFAKSGMFPAITNKYEAAAVIEYGRELGIKPIFALQTIAPVKGKLSIESKVLYALALKRGIKIEFIQKNSKGCVLKFSQKGRDSYTCSFTAEDAKTAGLSGKTSFLSYPEEMYFNRCVSKGVRAFDPRIFLGLVTREEAEDFSDSPLSKSAPEPEKPEEEKVKVEFKKSKEQPTPEPEKEEPTPEPKTEPSEEEIEEKKKLAESIKANLEKLEVDPKLFKKFLFEELQPKKPDREFVGINKFGHLSLNEGKLKDLQSLDKNIVVAVEEYHKSKTFEDEAKKTDPT